MAQNQKNNSEGNDTRDSQDGDDQKDQDDLLPADVERRGSEAKHSIHQVRLLVVRGLTI